MCRQEKYLLERICKSIHIKVRRYTNFKSLWNDSAHMNLNSVHDTCLHYVQSFPTVFFSAPICLKKSLGLKNQNIRRKELEKEKFLDNINMKNFCG